MVILENVAAIQNTGELLQLSQLLVPLGRHRVDHVSRRSDQSLPYVVKSIQYFPLEATSHSTNPYGLFTICRRTTHSSMSNVSIRLIPSD